MPLGPFSRWAPPTGEPSPPVGNQALLLAQQQRFPSGWARVKRLAYGFEALARFSVTEGSTPLGTFEVQRGQLVQVERGESSPGHVWVLVGPVRVSFPVDELEPADAPLTAWERLSQPERF